MRKGDGDLCKSVIILLDFNKKSVLHIVLCSSSSLLTSNFWWICFQLGFDSQVSKSRFCCLPLHRFSVLLRACLVDFPRRVLHLGFLLRFFMRSGAARFPPLFFTAMIFSVTRFSLSVPRVRAHPLRFLFSAPGISSPARDPNCEVSLPTWFSAREPTAHARLASSFLSPRPPIQALPCGLRFCVFGFAASVSGPARSHAKDRWSVLIRANCSRSSFRSPSCLLVQTSSVSAPS
jgi:hypothetical protein